MLSGKKTREPLLYIQQPAITYPEPNMQDIYSVKKAMKVKESKLKEEMKQETKEQESVILHALEEVKKVENRLPPEPEIPTPDAVLEAISSFEEERLSQRQGKTTSYSFNKVKSFKDMNIEEKLHYLINFPKLLPPVPCIYSTNTTSLRGFLAKKDSTMIEVKRFDGKIESLAIDQLTDIKMIGMN